ncbi:hypothetical protein NFI96_024586 [Prochilodus magdalenae]|nr:hypothetical protein NFI96_024586 [Prochilodus magdalenae]
MKKYWRLQRPNLVVSLVGKIDPRKKKIWVRNLLKEGLVQAAQGTDAWIITNGVNDCISRYIGEAVRDQAAAAASLNKSKVVALGVLPLGLVTNDQQGDNAQDTSQDSCYLDSNHQGFLLVDDGTIGRWGGEASVITDLEYHLSHPQQSRLLSYLGLGSPKIPVLCMLISGGSSVFERMDMSLKKNTPWLVISGSGPAANLITELLRDQNPSASPVEAESLDCSTPELRERVKEIVQKYFPKETELDKLVDQAISIYQSNNLITFHEKQDGLDDFHMVIFKALLRACKPTTARATDYREKLMLTVAWNRVDIARSELFSGNIQWKLLDLYKSMMDALVNDKPQFVRLFIENGLNVPKFTTYEYLEKLYQSLAYNTLAYSLLHKQITERHSPATLHSPTSECLNRNHTDTLKLISLYEVSQLLSEIFGGLCKPFYHDALNLKPGISSHEAAKEVNEQLQNNREYGKKACSTPWISLFIWAVLQNRKEMAMYFWEKSREPVLSALSACKILRELSKVETETDNEMSMKELAQTFENLAYDVFSACYQSSESRSFKLLFRTSSVWGGVTCLQMAVAADARHFFSHDGVQTALSQIWWGHMSKGTEVWKLIFSILVPPFIYTDLITFRSETLMSPFILLEENAEEHREEKAEEPREEKAEECVPKWSKVSIGNRWRQFWSAPVTSFLANVLMYFLFLCLFAYVLLFEFKPPPKGPAPIEFLLYLWVFTMFCEEIRQFFDTDNTRFLQNVKSYIKNKWNRFDFVAILLFCPGLFCRMYTWSYWFGRSVLCLDYMVFVLRLIHIFAINKELGPKIIIVGKMMKDLFFFLFLFGVWLLAYGVANQALLYSYDPRPYWVFRRIFYRPYLLIYGHLPLEELDVQRSGERECTNNMTRIYEGAEPCIQTEANWLVLVLLSVYLLVTNVVLLNLLIAMFGYTFNNVQDRSDVYWKWQRYELIEEYFFRSCLAPPFIIFSHLHIFIKRIRGHNPSRRTMALHILNHEDREDKTLNTWEAVQKENLLSTQSKTQRDSDTERIKRTSDMVDIVLKQIRDHDSKPKLNNIANNVLRHVQDFSHRLERLETEMEFCSSSLLWIMEGLAQSNLMKQTCPRPSPPPKRDVVPTSPSSSQGSSA